MKIELSKTQLYLEWLKTVLYLDSTAGTAKSRTIKRGEVYKCKLGVGIGSEEGKERPCVILQGDLANKKSSNTIVAPITHTTSKLPVVIPIKDKFDAASNKILDGNVLLGNIVTVSKARLGDYICTLTSGEMLKIDEAIGISMDIKKHYDKLNRQYNDKLDYIKKLRKKDDEYKVTIDSIKSLLSIQDDKDIIPKIQEIIEKSGQD